MEHCGLDMGRKSSHFCIVNEKRQVVQEGKVRNKPKALRIAFGRKKRMRIVLEASTKSFWMAEQLSELGHEPIVVDPGRTKAIGAARIKHDKLDARVLAELCQADLLARVSKPDRDVRLSRMTFTVRDSMVRARTRLINTVRSLADSEGVEIPHAKTESFLDAVTAVSEEFPSNMLEILAPLFFAIQELNEQIMDSDRQIVQAAKGDEINSLLQTCTGVGPIVAAGFVQAIRDPNRFKTGRSVGAYLGLVPSLYQSGRTSRSGHITRCGNRNVRWLMTMAANAFLLSKQDTVLRRWALSLKARTGRKKAVVALARKLATVLWAMWRDGRPYEAKLLQVA